MVTTVIYIQPQRQVLSLANDNSTSSRYIIVFIENMKRKKHIQHIKD